MKKLLAAFSLLSLMISSAAFGTQTFRLFDHGFGSLGPDYGLRLDYLDGSGAHNLFSVSNLDGAFVTLTYTDVTDTTGVVEIDGTVVRNSDNNSFRLNYTFEANRLGLPGDPFNGFKAVDGTSSGTLFGVLDGGGDFTFEGKSNGSYFGLLAFDGHRLPNDSSTGVFRGWVVDKDRPCCNDFLVTVGAIPEPATWLMMIIGFSVVGIAVQRRRKALFA
ncbi:PEPxxWA-CTERM sorting domain-containing protein [Kordiimonas sp. SCSIO 12610]|uniref:PEPxxWA-CTERM sorting domain-containing protein n=1 Tax=Kordiimonas sp. SCSIO 12610 TaxID=2829597 RepID=UPI002108D961|nr:PEPxxWA-CTERM sorting domain-containing protein [Kordiimonas sp. SCSIO 12610]UTW55728.1 PEPxxWA-CTERM sorting domain-containing protein [Kordiimonas sp. SCSIO 12610]